MTAASDRLRANLLRSWRAAAGAGLLLVLSNGPVLRFATGLLDRPGLWNDSAVWPFFAGAAAASPVLAWAVWRRGDGSAAGAGGEDPARRATAPVPLSRLALVATACYSAVAVASSLWSVYPGATLWRSVVYLGLILLGVALAGFTADELSTTLVLAASVAVAASLLVLLLQHEAGVDRDGNWIGVYTNRNSLAPMAALGVIAGLRWLLPGSMPAVWYGPRRAGRSAGAARDPSGGTSGPSPAVGEALAAWQRVWGAVLVTASLATLIGAGSRTSWLALAAALGLASALGAAADGDRRLLGWGPWRRGAAALGAMGVAAGLGAAVVAAAWNVPTFLQRRTIWRLAWDRVLERPWGGHGFFAFWEVPELVREHELLERGSAHNSLVETALGLGLAGTLPFVVLAVLAAVNAGRGLWLRPSADTGMWTAVTALVLLENVTESFVLWFSHIWVLLLVAALRRPISVAGS